VRSQTLNTHTHSAQTQNVSKATSEQTIGWVTTRVTGRRWLGQECKQCGELSNG